MEPSATTAADERTVAQAIRVLRDAGIISEYGRYNGLGEREAERAVQALTDAGLLRQPARPTAPAPRITFEQAEALNRMRATEHAWTRTIVRHADVLLAWSTAARAFRVTDHAGTHYDGEDLAAAVDAYNARVQPVGTTPARPTRVRVRTRQGARRA